MINMPGGPEMVVIMLVALMVLGPKELPKVMRTIGSVMAEVRKVSSGFQTEIRNAMESITDDTPAKPAIKPQSGTMTSVVQSEAQAEPASASTEAIGSEVVARNTDEPIVEPESAGNDAPTAAVTSPSVDAADRASG